VVGQYFISLDHLEKVHNFSDRQGDHCRLHDNADSLLARPASVKNGTGPTSNSECSKPTKTRPELSKPKSRRVREGQLDKLLVSIPIIDVQQFSFLNSSKSAGGLVPDFWVGLGDRAANLKNWCGCMVER
jgi:hypothetical protein